MRMYGGLIPVFSTCSMHIVTKLGTDVFSR